MKICGTSRRPVKASISSRIAGLPCMFNSSYSMPRLFRSLKNALCTVTPRTKICRINFKLCHNVRVEDPSLDLLLPSVIDVLRLMYLKHATRSICPLMSHCNSDSARYLRNSSEIWEVPFEGCRGLPDSRARKRHTKLDPLSTQSALYKADTLECLSMFSPNFFADSRKRTSPWRLSS